MKRLRSPSEVFDLSPPPHKRIIAQRNRRSWINQIIFLSLNKKKRKVIGDNNNNNKNDSSEVSDLRQTLCKRIKIKKSPEIMMQRRQTLYKAKKILKVNNSPF
ncbi:hypothetical protein Glove_217g261 [Diversispora epigaea]|uniref:Uncharacterized protein n=1 Tax=Diversispora epigaea TaxID=1348612 RepID=A0A397IJQ8_9GLOM|nr:hypothetical protein Glove_217g261 [Diversispora epigaea]